MPKGAAYFRISSAYFRISDLHLGKCDLHLGKCDLHLGKYNFHLDKCDLHLDNARQIFPFDLPLGERRSSAFGFPIPGNGEPPDQGLDLITIHGMRYIPEAMTAENDHEIG